MNKEEFHRKLTAILSADVQGYSRLMGEDEDSTIRTLTAYRVLMAALIQKHRGHVVDTPGDNLLAEFGSVMDSVRCAVEIQEELRIRNAELPENRQMQFRIGINLGDIIEEGDHIYGDGVNIAARVEGLAEGGGICISGTVYDAIRNKLSMSYEFMGEHVVKNIKEPVRIYRIRVEPEAERAIKKEKKARLRTWRWAALSVVAIIILGTGAIWYFSFRQIPAVEDVEKEPKTIAVLPFVNRSSEKDQEYFVDGLSDEIITRLSQISDLQVTSSTSSFTFKNSDKTIQEIAEILGREYILEGNVRKVGNALRITAQLIHTPDDIHLWSDTYDRELKDIFEIQEDIAIAVANELKVTLGIVKSFKQLGGTNNPKAYEFYLVAKGQYNIYNYKFALESLDSAIALDSEFALAWASKSIVHTCLSIYRPENRVAAEQNVAMHAAQKAIELEPDMAAGYYALGYAKSMGGDFIGARLAYSNALELTDEPLSFIVPVVPVHYIVAGYFEKANELLEEMLITDPLNLGSRGWYVWSFIFLVDTQRALEETEHIRLLYEGQLGDFWISYVNLWTGNIVTYDEIDSYNTIFGSPDLIFKAAMEHLDSPKEAIGNLRRIYADKKNLSALQFFDIALWATYFADQEFAMEAMEETIRMDPENIFAFYFPLMKEFRQMPRFKELVKEVGLVDYWNRFGWPDICRPLDNGDFECD